MALFLSDEKRGIIEQQGSKGFPDEVCGFLVGTAKGDDKTITDVWPIENGWSRQAIRLPGPPTLF